MDRNKWFGESPRRAYIGCMTQMPSPFRATSFAAALTMTLVLGLAPAMAQTTAPETVPDTLTPAPEAPTDPTPGEGLGLIEEGARLFFRGIISEMEPMLDSLRDRAVEIEPALRALARQMGPALVEMMTRIDDIRHYEAPELLENGDIIIRRSPDAPPFVPRDPDAQAPAPGEQIDL